MMVKRIALLALFSAALAGAAHAQSIFPGGPRFDGTVKVTKLTGPSCPPGFQGQTFPAVFVAKKTPTTKDRERISIGFPTFAGAYFMVANGDGTLGGVNQKAESSYIIDGWRDLPPVSTLNLTFTPKIIKDSTPSFTFKGRVSNLAFQGCTANIQGNFQRRTIP